MKEKIKQMYVPCQLDVVEFKVERGFAGSPGTMDAINGANNVINGWSYSNQEGNANRNQSYAEDIWAWNDEHSF